MESILPNGNNLEAEAWINGAEYRVKFSGVLFIHYKAYPCPRVAPAQGANNLETAHMRAQQKATFAARGHVGENVFVMYVHVEPRVLIVEQKNTVEKSGGKGMAVTERVREPGLASQNFAQIFCRCRV